MSEVTNSNEPIATGNSDQPIEEEKCENLPDIVTTTEKGSQQNSAADEPPTDSNNGSVAQESRDVENSIEEQKNEKVTEPTTANESAITSDQPKEETSEANAVKPVGSDEAAKQEDLSNAVSDETKAANDAGETEKEQETGDLGKTDSETGTVPENQEQENLSTQLKESADEAKETKEAEPASEETPKAEKTSEDSDKCSNVERKEAKNESAGDETEEEEFDDEEADDEEGDEGGEDESAGDEEDEELDEDEIKTSPAYIPKHGNFYMHDVRGDSKQEEEEEKTEDDKSKSAARSRTDRKWEHDLFDERQQKPKHSKELLRRYGRDIRRSASDDNEPSDDNEEKEEKRVKQRFNQRVNENATQVENREAQSSEQNKETSSRDEAPRNRPRRVPLQNPRRQHQAELPAEGDLRQNRTNGRRQNNNDYEGSSPPRNSGRGTFRGPMRGVRKPNIGNYRTIVSSRFTRPRQDRFMDRSPRNQGPFESSNRREDMGNRRGTRQPANYGGRFDQGAPPRYGRSNIDEHNYGRRNEGRGRFNRQSDRNDAFDTTEDDRGGVSTRGGGGKRYTAQRHAPTNSDFPSNSGGQSRRQGYDNKATRNNNHSEQEVSNWNESPAGWDQSNTHSAKSYGPTRSSGYHQQQSGGRGESQMHYPEQRYAQPPMGPPPGGIRTDIPPPPMVHPGGQQNYNNSQRNYGPPQHQHFQSRQQAVVYPHPRQPTEPVFFDPQQQQMQYASPSVMAGGPPHPGGARVRRQLNIAPPGQHQ